MKAKELLLLSNYPSVLIYGAAGSGKTGLVSQSPKSYMLDFDNGMRTAAILEDKFTPLRQDCEFDTFIDDNPFIPTAWLRAEKKLEEIQKQSASGTIKYDTIIIDSLTGLARCMQLQVMMQATSDPFRKPQIQHWGSLVNAMEKVLTILRATKCLLLVTAHELSFEVDSMHLVRPLSVTKGHSENKIAWLFDEVLHMRLRQAGANKHKYMISGHSTASIMARTRSKMKEEIDVTDIGLAGVLEKIGYKK